MKLMLLFLPQNKTLHTDLCSQKTAFNDTWRQVSTKPLAPRLQKSAVTLHLTEPFPETPLKSVLHFDVTFSPVHHNMRHQPPPKESF